MFTQSFLDEIKRLALQIAIRQRGEDHLQPVGKLKEKLIEEYRELAETTHAWDEIPDVTYYTACLVLQGDAFAQSMLQGTLLLFGETLARAEAATLAKYRLRATQPKDIIAERAAIMAALGELEKQQ